MKFPNPRMQNNVYLVEKILHFFYNIKCSSNVFNIPGNLYNQIHEEVMPFFIYLQKQNIQKYCWLVDLICINYLIYSLCNLWAPSPFSEEK